MIGAAFIMLFLASAHAYCSTPAMPYAMITGRLVESYSESMRGWEVDEDGTLLQFWASDTGSGSWTIVRVTVNGRACIAQSGFGWVPRPGVDM